MILLGSRDQMCTNPEVNQHSGMILTSKCKNLRSQKNGASCQFYKNTVGKRASKKVDWQVRDIEDLHKVGQEHTLCPYYLQKARVAEADVIFMPYNYILDSNIRNQFTINFEESVIIFDEAHNIERVCEEISSFEISVSALNEVLFELSNLTKSILSMGAAQSFTCEINQVTALRDLTTNFRDRLKDLDASCLKDSRKLLYNC